MKNITELIQHLATVFEDTKAGAVKAKESEALANIAGKMINACKVQVEYYALRKESPNIAFLNEDVEGQRVGSLKTHKLGDEEPKKP